RPTSPTLRPGSSVRSAPSSSVRPAIRSVRPEMTRRLMRAVYRRAGLSGKGLCGLPARPKAPARTQGEQPMAIERTFSIIKPDATRRNLTGKINAVFEGNGLRIVAQKRIRMTKAQAESFYGVHKERPFFAGL